MAARVVLDEATIISATGAPPFEGAVVVEGARIADVIEGRRSPGAGDERIIKLAGRSVLPGLIDAHVHATAVDADIGSQSRRRYESEVALLAGVALGEMLARGFTTVRDAGGADAGFRRAVEQGAIAGPRLLVSGRPLTQTGGHGDQRSATEYDSHGCGQHVGMVHAIADGPQEVRRAAREELRRGADQIKVMASGGVVSPTDRLESVQYSLEELSSAVAAAEAVGTYVLAHAYTPASISVCVEAGVRSIEHGNLLDEVTAKLMAEHGTFLVPTLVTYEKLHSEGARHGVPKESLDKLARIIDAGLESLTVAADAGVRIASGSDLLGPMRRYQGEEIAIKARAIGAMAAIVAATRTNAELLGLEQEIGTIEVGKQADLVVVSGDALEDPGLLGREGGVVAVVLGGRLVHDRLGLTGATAVQRAGPVRTCPGLAFPQSTLDNR
jgi:imidazolonepropionase-like amidohydrolase